MVCILFTECGDRELCKDCQRKARFYNLCSSFQETLLENH
jgi:hypothetical protein